MALKISRILHAGYVFECEGVKIAFDPIFENPFSRNCFAFPAVTFDHEAIRRERFSAVFISHYHDDHFSLESLDLLNRATPIYMFTVHEELLDLIRELGFHEVHALDLNIPLNVGPIKVTPRRALDADVDSLFQIEAEGRKVLNVVDSWIDDETLRRLEREKPWDMILWPFQTLRELEVLAPSCAQPAPANLPEEWLMQLRLLAPRYVVPSSCQFRFEEGSWYNQAFFPVTYGQFRREVEAAVPGAQSVRLDPSAALILQADGFSPVSSPPWVRRLDFEVREYDYREGLVPPSTSDIARRLGALHENQRARILAFCRRGLLEKKVTVEDSSYFYEERSWKLSVYDDRGFAEEFHYRVQGPSIHPAERIDSPDWSTEIPAVKLWAALEEGESLTSLYVRITPPSSAEDLLEDPLLVRLFNKDAGSYQKHQLRRLKSR